MRKLEIFVLFAAIIAMFTACKSDKDIYSTPEKVMETFTVAFVTADFDVMYKTTVPHDAALIRDMQKYMRNDPERAKKMNELKVDVKDTECKYTNDTLALCTCRFFCDNRDQSITFRTKKLDGKWLVDMSED